MPERCRMALRAHAARRPHAPGALHTAAQVCVLREAQPGALHTAAPAGPSRSPGLLTLKLRVSMHMAQPGALHGTQRRPRLACTPATPIRRR